MKIKFNISECYVAVHKMEDPLSLRKAKPSPADLKKKDPLLVAFKDIRPDEVDSLLADDTTPTKETSSKILEEIHETNDGSMKIAHYGARKCVAPDC